jgi:tetratricopeptide (TPR) repeat protein
MRIVFLLLLFTASAAAQRHRIEEINAEKPEGKLVQQIMQEADAAKKLPLMEQFAAEYPKHEYTPWVLEQLQQAYVKAGDAPKTIAAGDKLIAIDPDDPEANLQNLKAAETQKDLPAIRKYAAATSAAARKMASAPQPTDAEAVAAWKNEVDYAKQVDAYADYALYRVALEARDPKVAIEFGEALVQHNPKSEYAAKLPQTLFTAYRQSNDIAKAVAIAEQTLAKDQSNEDMLLVVANSYLEQKKEPQKVHEYSAKAAEVVSAKPAPCGAGL